ADAPLAGHDGHDRAHARQARKQPGLLGLDLSDDVGAAVAGDVTVLLHGRASACHAARATRTSASTVTTTKTSAPARTVSAPPHGAATLAVSARSATWATLNARYAMSTARMRAKSVRLSSQRSNHARGRRSK